LQVDRQQNPKLESQLRWSPNLKIQFKQKEYIHTLHK